MVVGLLFTGLTCLLGTVAVFRLWHTGDAGWRRAIFAVLVGLACLFPYAFAGVQAIRFPWINDVSTDFENPPHLLVNRLDGDVPQAFPLAAQQTISASFPNAQPRIYPLSDTLIYELVQMKLDEYGWEVRQARPPVTSLQAARIVAVATTLTGFRDQVALRILASGEGTRVDMRSASTFAGHDLGANGTRIETFLLALDEVVKEEIKNAIALQSGS